DNFALDELLGAEPIDVDRIGPTIEIGDLDDDEPPVDLDDITPLEVIGEADRKSPTIADRSDMTMEFQGLPEVDQPLEQTGEPVRKTPTVADRSDMTMEFGALPGAAGGEESKDKPTRRSTHTLESDKTIDLAMSPAEARHMDSQWRGTYDL